MSDFARTFLRERIGDETQTQEFFGLFGKHPGWDDHIEDLPLPTESMVAAKQLLYVQGIGSQISSGAWARLPAEESPEFNHTLLWVRGRQFLLGKLWSSRDGKRRAHFPMIALVQAVNAPLEAAFGPVLVKLDELAAGCRATSSSAKVRNLIARVSSEAAMPAEEPQEEAHATLAVPRSSVLHLARDLRGNLPPRFRLPADPENFVRSLRFWSRLVTALSPPDIPLLFLAAEGVPWLDVLAREPAPGYFFCLRAGLSSLPITYAPDAQETVDELDADGLIKTVSDGKSPPGRSWFSRMLGN